MYKRLAFAALIAFSAVALALAAPTTGQAKAKKKMAEAMPIICPLTSKPVCAVFGGQRFTYANSCFAAKNGAKVIRNRACWTPHKAMHKMKKKMTKKKM
jgi:hypothetical protein